MNFLSPWQFCVWENSNSNSGNTSKKEKVERLAPVWAQKSAGWKSSHLQTISFHTGGCAINQQHTRSCRIWLFLQALSLWSLHVLLSSSSYPSVLLPPVDWGGGLHVWVWEWWQMDPGVFVPSSLHLTWCYTSWKSLGKFHGFSQRFVENEENLENSVVWFPHEHTFLS